jgi:membrane-associated phospholipid phosphatase
MPECIRWYNRRHSGLFLPLFNVAAVPLALLLGFAENFEAKAGDSIETAGDILQLVLPAAAAGLTFGYRDWPGAVQFGESAGVTLGVTYALKYSIHETRPNGSSESFPSAHSSISFASAEFMRKRYGWEYGIPAYALASFVAYSRVESGNHWPHDVIAGAGIGILSSYIFTKPYKGWHFQFEGGDRYYGFRVNRAW